MVDPGTDLRQVTECPLPQPHSSTMSGKLYAISDIHVSYKFNMDEFTSWLSSLKSHSQRQVQSQSTDSIDDDGGGGHSGQTDDDHTGDGLILAGDISERLEHLRICFEMAVSKFKTVWWVPGNHELYTMPSSSSSGVNTSSPGIHDGAVGTIEAEEAERRRDRLTKDMELNSTARGEVKYRECCRVARDSGVLTPEDEYIRWEYDVPAPVDHGKTKREAVLVCPIFTLYDYSFRPPHVSREQALDWAMEEDIQATDEVLLHPDPYPTRDAWCKDLLTRTEAKLQRAVESHNLPLVIVNHWPLREDLVHIPRVPRFSLWCGTKRTNDWHVRFNAKVVVTGHLHVRRTDWKDGCRFEEVSLGYPRHWEGVRSAGKGVKEILRKILPGEYGEDTDTSSRETIWRRNG